MAKRCSNCGNENPDDYAFCDECGARITGEGSMASMPGGAAPAAMAAPASTPATGGLVRCPSCGAENVAGAAFCDECGAALEPGVAAPATGTAAAVDVSQWARP